MRRLAILASIACCLSSTLFSAASYFGNKGLLYLQSITLEHNHEATPCTVKADRERGKGGGMQGWGWVNGWVVDEGAGTVLGVGEWVVGG